MSFERPLVPSVRATPELDGLVEAGGGQGLAVRAVGQIYYPVRMPGENRSPLARHGVPPSDGSIATARSQRLAIGLVSQAINDPLMPDQCAPRLAIGRVPKAYGLVR